MSRRITLLPRLLAVLGLVMLTALAVAPASEAVSGVWGELGHFGDKSGELRHPEQAFGINPEDGSAWTVDSTIVGGNEVFRIQKFEQVSGTWKVVASRNFRSAELASEPEATLEVEGVAFDPVLHRAYVLVDQERFVGPAKEEQAASELWAFSTTTSSTTIEPASETTEGLLVEQTAETLKTSPVGQTKFAPEDKEKGLSLVAPGGITVNPSNHQVLITGWTGAEIPQVWAISQKGKIETVWEDEKGFFEKCGCLNSPVVASGKILVLSDNEEEVYELPANLSSATAPKRAFWLPATRFECETLEREKQEGKQVETCPFVEKLNQIESGHDLGGEMSSGPEGDVYIHIKIPDAAEGENKFGGVMILSPTLEELGWTGGGSSASASKACAVNETGINGGGAALVGGAGEHVFMYERGEVVGEQAKILELGSGGSITGCPKGSATPPKATAGGEELSAIPITDKIVFTSSVTQANALSTEWEFEPGVKEVVTKRQQQTTSVEHKFAHGGTFTVLERIHSDDLATPLIETSVKVTILGPPKVREEKATVEGTSATLKAEVDPNLKPVMTCEFQYGPVAEALGSASKKVACPTNPGEGEEFVSETVKVSGLEAGKEYHFRLFAKSASGETEARETKFLVKESGAPEGETLSATGVGSTAATLNGKVNPEGAATKCMFEYGTTTAYGKVAPCASEPGAGSSPVAVLAEVNGLTGSTTYHFRVVAENSGAQKGIGADKEFKTTEAGAKPSVETLPAGAVTQLGATLKGTVNPHGETTECHFEYGTTVSYGKEAPCPSAPGNGRANVEESAPVSGLSPGTPYHFRLVAKNPLGEEEGSDKEFTTAAKLAPTAETLGASSVTSTTATLTGTVNPKGEATSCKFLYGPTTAYGKEVACAASPGSGSGAVAVSAAIAALTPSTVYHYRLIAESTAGKGEGADAELRSSEVKPVVGGGTSTTTTPTTTTTPRPPPGGGVSGFKEASPTVTLAGTALAVTGSGGFSLKLSCPAGATQCAGTITLKTLTAVSASVGAAKKKKAILTLASGSFTIAGGKLKLVSLHMSAKGKALLAKLHTVRARVTVLARNPQGAAHTTTAVVTLKAPKKKH